mmetsp:Transcript_6548/g.21890  ORF Transcript_6548/g.21890 Transcript_6548/m.21890 type:complete len:166 (-) Transcript_6548:115-612(-)
MLRGHQRTHMAGRPVKEERQTAAMLKPGADAEAIAKARLNKLLELRYKMCGASSSAAMASEASDAASRALEGFGDARSIERVGSMGSFGSAAGSPEEGMSEVSVPGSAVPMLPAGARAAGIELEDLGSRVKEAAAAASGGGNGEAEGGGNGVGEWVSFDPAVARV